MSGQQPAPPRVKDIEAYWGTGDQPPEPSARLGYWVQKIHDGWRPGKRIRMLGYYSSAGYYGVYLWEYINVLSPLIDKFCGVPQLAEGPAVNRNVAGSSPAPTAITEPVADAVEAEAEMAFPT